MNPLHYLEDRFERFFPDWYWEATLRFYLWRERRFPWFYAWKHRRRHRANMLYKFGFVPGVGDLVEDCRGQVHRIAELDADDPDTVIFADGFGCSLWNCCDVPKETHASHK